MRSARIIPTARPRSGAAGRPARHREGQSLLVNLTTVPLQTIAGGSAAGTIVIIEDITERSHMEEQLRISEKMASLGLLAAGVAHEVNTPLTGISGYTQMLLENADPPTRARRCSKNREADVPRRPHRQRPAQPVAAQHRGCHGADRRRHQRGDRRRAVAARTPVREGSVKVRRGLHQAGQRRRLRFKLQQVFLNLFLNARDAMPSGGWLAIATRVDGGEVVAEVADTSNGIAAEHLARIYDPFFTTKPMGQAQPRSLDHLRHRPRARGHDSVQKARRVRARGLKCDSPPRRFQRRRPPTFAERR